MNWHELASSGTGGNLSLEKIPKKDWFLKCQGMGNGFDGYTLLHIACLGNNLKALQALIHHGLDVNATTNAMLTPLLMSIMIQNPENVELLLRANADHTRKNHIGHDIWTILLNPSKQKTSFECGKVLLMHNIDTKRPLPLDLVKIRQGIRRCKAVTIAMIRVKRAGKLHRWDKYLLIFMARQIWSTRDHKNW